jgi:Uncharacterized proteins, LmbE homologs
MKIMVISPHADDETLGAGGTLLKYREKDHKIYWLNITNIKKKYGYKEEKEQMRINEMKLVREAYQFDGVYDLGLEPAGLHKYEFNELINMIKEVIIEVNPNTVILPFMHDVHSDHRVVFDAVYSCTKAFRYPYINNILCMEILSETDYAVTDNGFIPNYYVGIDKYLDKKIDIMKVYSSEIEQPPFPRSLDGIKSLAKFRGGSCGNVYAEAFRIIKMIEH